MGLDFCLIILHELEKVAFPVVSIREIVISGTTSKSSILSDHVGANYVGKEKVDKPALKIMNKDEFFKYMAR